MSSGARSQAHIFTKLFRTNYTPTPQPRIPKHGELEERGKRSTWPRATSASASILLVRDRRSVVERNRDVAKEINENEWWMLRERVRRSSFRSSFNRSSRETERADCQFRFSASISLRILIFQCPREDKGFEQKRVQRGWLVYCNTNKRNERKIKVSSRILHPFSLRSWFRFSDRVTWLCVNLVKSVTRFTKICASFFFL